MRANITTNPDLDEDPPLRGEVTVVRDVLPEP